MDKKPESAELPFIPFALPSIGAEEEEAVLRVLRSGWLTTGKETLEFEKEFAKALGAEHALAVNSATAGLHLSLEALGLKQGDKVITTPFTFTATAEVFRYLGADPLFVDIDQDTLNIDPLKAAEAAEKDPSVKGIVPVHLGGLMADMKSLTALAGEQNIFLLEDAAHAFPVASHAGKAGTIGDAGVFSFYATKTITTGEGGMVVTDNGDLAKRMSVMRLHGIDRDVWDRYSSGGSWLYSVVDAGYKYNMTDIAAAMGRVQLKRAEVFKERRKAIAQYYNRELGDIEAFNLPGDGNGEDHAWHLYIIRLREHVLSIDRDTLIRKLSDRGIGTSVHYRALHLMPYYRERYKLLPSHFPAATRASESCISLPIYPEMHKEQVCRVVETLREIAGESVRRGKVR
jgi:dTDP-4-amino-4,6-dideoxygalactose transaminase